jgi:hypothetical protein
MDDFLELGLEACDVIIDKGFDKLPDRVVSPLAADVHMPKAFRRKKAAEARDSPNDKGIDKRGRGREDSASLPPRRRRRRDDSISSTSSSSSEDSRYDRTRDYVYNQRGGRYASGDPRNRRESPRGIRRIETAPAERTPYPSSQAVTRRGNDRDGDVAMPDNFLYAPNPNYASSERPRFRTRRSQSVNPSVISRRRSPSPLAEKKEINIRNQLAMSAVGAAVGGLLANTAGRATDRRASSHASPSKTDSKSDEVMLTLAGMVLGGVGASVAQEAMHHKKKRRERRLRDEERRQAEQAVRDWEREGHEFERTGWEGPDGVYETRRRRNSTGESEYRMSGGYGR